MRILQLQISSENIRIHKHHYLQYMNKLEQNICGGR